MMLKLKPSLLGQLHLGRLPPRALTLGGVTKECVKWYSSRPQTARNSRWRTAILCTLGGGVAIGAGFVATCSLFLPHPLEESLPGVQEAGCKEKDKKKKDKRKWKDEFVEAGRRGGDVDGSLGLQEAVRQSRELLGRTKDELGSPGIVAAVSVDGRLLWAEGFGYADVENRLPCTSHSIHRIASISKSFTMTAVAKLWEEGKLDLDKPVQHYVPEFPEKEVDGKKVDVTTRQLVSHLAGIRHYSRNYIKKLDEKSKKDSVTTDTKDPKDSKNPPKDAKKNDAPESKNKKEGGKKSDSKKPEFYVTKDYSSVIDALEMFKEDPLMHPPGSKFFYTTHGWTLVSAVVEGAANKDFLAYMKRIFKDLGMFHTVPDEARPLIYNRARGYARNKKGRLTNAAMVNLSHKWAGGGFLSDVRDLIQFGNTMLYSYQYTNRHKDAGLLPGYLKPETMRAIWSPVPLTKCSWDTDGVYAMGWAVREKGEHRGFCPEKHHLVSHTGGAVGASSVLLLMNQKNPDVVVNDSEQVPTGTDQNNVPKDGGSRDSQMQVGIQNREEMLPSKDSLSLPQGIVVAVIANLEDVSLYKTAVEIAEVFQKVNCSL